MGRGMAAVEYCEVGGGPFIGPGRRGEWTGGVRPVVDFNSFGFSHETGRGMDETPGECGGRGAGRAAHRFGSTRAREDGTRRRMARRRGPERQRLLGRPKVGDDAGGGLAGRIGWVG
jgi:hypothetical protein